MPLKKAIFNNLKQPSMKKAILIMIVPFLVLSFIGLTSCKNKTSKKTKAKEAEQVDTIKKAIVKNVYPLPTSAQVIKMLTELEVGYQIGITNPAENSKKYYTNRSRAIAVGVYGADLSYVTLYNIMGEVTKYMDVIKSLAYELNMSQIYNAALYDSIKANFDNRDKLVDILTKAFNDTYAYMSENDQQTLALLVVGSAWVEGMYLTCIVSEAAYQDARFSKVLLEQKKSFELYLDLTKPYMQDASISDLIKAMDPIQKVYQGLGTSLTLKNIKDITNAINIVRDKIIQ
jgi:hypothetical protein